MGLKDCWGGGEKFPHEQQNLYQREKQCVSVLEGLCQEHVMSP